MWIIFWYNRGKKGGEAMALEIHEIWEMVKNILEILDKIYHAVVKE